MLLQNFTQTPLMKIGKINEFLTEEFGIEIAKNQQFPKLVKLQHLKESAEQQLMTLRVSNKKFQLDPEYAKFLGIKDVVETMIAEGMYAESPAYMEMKTMIADSVRQLMDSGYTEDEASRECMNRYRMDNRFAYDDEHVLPIVLNAAKQYYESCNSTHMTEADPNFEANIPIGEGVLQELAKELGLNLQHEGTMGTLEEKLGNMATVSGKRRNAIVEFLNGLEEAQRADGIRMFGKKIREANRFAAAKRQAIEEELEEFEYNGEMHASGWKPVVEEDDPKEKVKESVDISEAEVVMAVRALEDDIQDQVERIGRMMNEDVPAITDQIRNEMGADQASSFADSMNATLSAYLEAARSAKAEIGTTASGLSGDAPVGGLGDTDLGGDLDGLGDLGDMDDAIDANEPPAAGPEDEPLGRATI